MSAPARRRLAGLALLLLLGALRAAADTGEGAVDITWQSPRQFLKGEERKVYPGETVRVEVDPGEQVDVNHEAWTERTCSVDDIGCSTYTAHRHAWRTAAQAPPSVVLTQGDTAVAGPALVFPQQAAVLQVPLSQVENFARDHRIQGYVPDPPTAVDRGDAHGTFTLRVTIDSGGRLALLPAYLQTPRTELQLRAALNPNLRAQHPKPVAALLLGHVTQHYRLGPGAGAQVKDQHHLILRLAQELDPGNGAVNRALASYFLSEGDFAAAESQLRGEVQRARDANDHEALGDAYAQLAQATERHRAGLGPSDLQEADALLALAVEEYGLARSRIRQASALLERARILHRIHSRPALQLATEQLERARELLPARLRGAPAAVSPEGSHLVTAQGTVGFTISSLATGATSELMTGRNASWSALAVDADGTLLVREDPATLLWFDPRTRAVTLVPGAPPLREAEVAARAIAGLTDDGRLALVSAGGAPDFPAIGSDFVLDDYCLAGDGKTYAVSVAARPGPAGAPPAAQARVLVNSIEGNVLWQSALPVAARLSRLALSSDGRYLAGLQWEADATRPRRWVLFDTTAAGASAVPLSAPPDAADVALASAEPRPVFSHAGNLLVYDGATGGQLASVASGFGPEAPIHLRPLPGGEVLLVNDERAAAWNPASGAVRGLATHLDPALARDGTGAPLVSVRGGDAAVFPFGTDTLFRVLSLPDGREVHTLRARTAGILQLGLLCQASLLWLVETDGLKVFDLRSGAAVDGQALGRPDSFGLPIDIGHAQEWLLARSNPAADETRLERWRGLARLADEPIPDAGGERLLATVSFGNPLVLLAETRPSNPFGPPMPIIIGGRLLDFRQSPPAAVRFRVPDGLEGKAFSPRDGLYVASGAGVLRWALGRGEAPPSDLDLGNPPLLPLDVHLSRDGQTLALEGQRFDQQQAPPTRAVRLFQIAAATGAVQLKPCPACRRVEAGWDRIGALSEELRPIREAPLRLPTLPGPFGGTPLDAVLSEDLDRLAVVEEGRIGVYEVDTDRRVTEAPWGVPLLLGRDFLLVQDSQESFYLLRF